MRRLSFVLVVVAACSGDASIGKGRNPADYDALAQIANRKDGVKNGKGTLAHVEDRLGLPTFIWANRAPQSAARRMQLPVAATDAARMHLADYADRYRLSSSAVADAKLVSVHDLGDGPIIATFQQEVAGVEVFRNRLAIVMDRNNEVVALSGFLSPNAEGAAARLAFTIEPSDAVAFAFTDLTGYSMQAGDLAEETAEASYTSYSADSLSQASGLRFSTPARAKRVMFDLPGALVPAYYVEIDVGLENSKSSDAYAYVIAADDGRMLFRKNLTSDAAYSYSVWADEEGKPLDNPLGKSTPSLTGVPDDSVLPYIAQTQLTVANFPFSKNDPWLPVNATNTFGNNVMAYADLQAPDGFGPGDLLPYPSAPGSFARPFDPARAPNGDQTQLMAATTQLFYVTNFLHDWYYDAGFDEAAGNAQLDNFMRGGVAADPLHAEAQDFGGRNNANMSTPADGKSPRMQMYLFDSTEPSEFEITAPAALAGSYASAAGSFYKPAIALSGDVAIVDDGNAAPAIPATDTAPATPAGTVNDGCETPFTTSVAGKIALIDRGRCAFAVKAANALAQGAVGMIVANNRAGAPTAMPADPINLPSVMIEQTTGAALRAQLLAGAAVTVHYSRPELIDRDGTIDNLVVAHEWGHYISNRLIGNGAGLAGKHQSGLGEGWADFHSLLLTARESDLNRPNNAQYRGAYVQAAYAFGGQSATALYFGFRRVPYSVDFKKNPLTLKHIQDGVALPEFAPVAFGQDGADNSEAHNTGEVWASMLWECYVALLQETTTQAPRLTFVQARERMKRYIVAAYKITPVMPTILEARDAVLAAAYAGDPADFVLFQQAFARRGAGLRAVAPNRFTQDNAGVAESYLSGNDVAIVGATIAETTSKCPADGILDNGDTATITLAVKNVGTGFLSATTATVSTTTAGVTFPNGPVVLFDSMDPFQGASAQIVVALGGVTDITRIDFSLAVTDPTLAFGDSVTMLFPVVANFDEVPASAKTDDVEAPHPVWVTRSEGAPATWSREAMDVQQHVFFGRSNPAAASDMYLISPKLEVGAANLVVSFSHTYAFEFDPQNFYDGGVIELSTDGLSWTDIGGDAYNATIFATSGNALAGRKAFGGTAQGFPALQRLSIDLGKTYANQSVLIRFRSASDSNSAALGWIVDDITIDGMTNTPFSSVVPELGCGH